MNVEEFYALPVNQNPVLCADGLMGMLIQLPYDDSPLAGVQVNGEDDMRWIHCAHLRSSPRGALTQTSAPVYPNLPSNMMQLILCCDWVKLGGMDKLND